VGSKGGAIGALLTGPSALGSVGGSAIAPIFVMAAAAAPTSIRRWQRTIRTSPIIAKQCSQAFSKSRTTCGVRILEHEAQGSRERSCRRAEVPGTPPHPVQRGRHKYLEVTTATERSSLDEVTAVNILGRQHGSTR